MSSRARGLAKVPLTAFQLLVNGFEVASWTAFVGISACFVASATLAWRATRAATVLTVFGKTGWLVEL